MEDYRKRRHGINKNKTFSNMETIQEETLTLPSHQLIYPNGQLSHVPVDTKFTRFEEMADRIIVPPYVGIWSPNVIILFIAIYLLIHTVRETAPSGIKIPAIFKKNRNKE